MVHPASELRYIGPEVGFGVVATEFIPRGTVTRVRDELDQVISPARLAAAPALLREAIDKYSYLNGKGERILCWDHSHQSLLQSDLAGSGLRLRDRRPGHRAGRRDH